ncbi:hypothetical protein J437_LFUL008616 [Ladona fulva]|uniref:Uncharacterized protein n=1 Tax=Ladona fulva TaxID=123851 RepID=A0A8K0P138_LADFU|nr:hypothetical protein J437_LFUL008616 [Ladona fulva]
MYLLNNIFHHFCNSNNNMYVWDKTTPSKGSRHLYLPNNADFGVIEMALRKKEFLIYTIGLL